MCMFYDTEYPVKVYQVKMKQKTQTKQAISEKDPIERVLTGVALFVLLFFISFLNVKIPFK